MCKVMIIPSVKSGKEELAWKIAKAAAPKLSTGNSDGFGYAAMDAQGQVFGERWLDNDLALKPNFGLSDGDAALINILSPDLVKEKMNLAYSSTGTVNKANIINLMLHARHATTEKGIKNAHPFIKDNVGLIHNGIISNHEKLRTDTMMSTCDSEVILTEYLDFNVMSSPEQFTGVVESIVGYYALGIAAIDANGIPYVDVVKSAKARLHVTYVNELESVIFATSEYDLKEVIKECNLTANKIFEVTNDRYMRFNSYTGEKLASFAIDSVEYERTHNTTYQDDFDKTLEKYKGDVNYVQMMIDEEASRSAKLVGGVQ